MRIRFETIIDDIVAFNRYHQANSPTARRLNWLTTALVPIISLLIVGMLLFGMIDRLQRDPLVFWVMAAAFGFVLIASSIGWFCFVRWGMPRINDRLVRRMLAE